ncbi:MAG: hypothetical protein B7Y80_01515 [Hyphomicrobium sp. 32-62-53]|nr:MAG: hypothetical protein B7Z29_01865 [Hyphomicrobium sp. 12-62-95]OYY01432.1 MAG: hypothetical protein B7Y80_01515 [Hyphomicrobium sp. 32-62-53]
MTVVATMPKFTHDWLVHELDPQLYRRAGVIVSGSGVLRTGTVLGKITASGKYAPLDPAASNGAQNAAAIVLNLVDATAADAETAILVGHAQIVPSELTWPAAADTTNERNAALAQLEALGIVSHQRL